MAAYDKVIVKFLIECDRQSDRVLLEYCPIIKMLKRFSKMTIDISDVYELLFKWVLRKVLRIRIDYYRRLLVYVSMLRN